MEELLAEIRNQIEVIQALYGITMPKGVLVRFRADLAGAKSPAEVATLLKRFERWKDTNSMD